MTWSLIVGVLFYIGCAINVSEGNTLEAVATFILGTALVGVWWIHRNELKHSTEFLEWLLVNRAAVEQGVALYNGKSVRMDSEITRFQTCVSALVITTRFPSRYL